MTFIIIAIFIAIFILIYNLTKHLERKNKERFCIQLNEALETIINALRAGTSFLQAMNLAIENAEDPFAKEFRQVFEEYRMGMPLEKGLDRLAIRLPLEEIQSLTAAIRISQTSGGSLASVLEKLCKNLREQQHLKQRILALSSQGKLQGWIMGLVPFVLLIFMYLMDPILIQNFFHNPFGQTLFGLMIIAEGIAFWMIQNILNIKV